MTNIIDHQSRPAGGPTFQSVSPCKTDVIWTGNESTRDDVVAAVSSSRIAFSNWSLTPLEERLTICEEYASRLTSNSETLASTISRETGKPMWEARTEVTAMTNKIAISVASYRERTGTSRKDNLGLTHKPHGVMAVFGPYNFPGHLPNGHIVPALIAGNTVVLKPSDQAPATAELMVKLWIEAGLPEGVVNLVQGKVETGIALANADISGLLFTGSSNVGTLLHKQFGGRPEVLLALEMGGNNALIVGDYLDVDRAVETTINSAFLSAGQRCTCARRVIIVKSETTQTFVDKLIEMAQRLIIDGTQDEGQEAFMGPVINSDTAHKLLEAQSYLSTLGAKTLLEMHAVDSTGVRLAPGILDVSNVKNLPDEEWFGPMLQICLVDDFETAITMANTTKYGLAAGLLSDDKDEQHLFLQHIKAGVTSINAPTAGASSALPFGGIGASGNHRPSAFYAADYCAWPQATMFGGSTADQNELITRGLK